VDEAVILVDTSAWIHHLRKKDVRLVGFLSEHRVRTSDVVLGELLLEAGLPKTFARDLAALPRVPSPTAAETRAFIERHSESFAGSGVGWADAQILAAASRAGTHLHSTDRAVRKVCRALGLILA
jgi:predicted nucleic acid-binding protein